MKKYLLLCVEIEETVARIYRQLSSSSKVPGELKLILANLANDEDDHAMQLRFAMRFPAGTALVDKRIDRAPAEELLIRAKKLYNQTCQSNFDTRRAIEMGIELEQDFCQTHIGNSMDFTDNKLKKMFAALAQDDKSHKQKLIDAKNRFL
ncbi:MAG: hypothetical protein L3J63_07670 [Geopsychrobacter sp.]|nr:hypothetical protein [Geopsychrobacter sp.]